MAKSETFFGDLIETGVTNNSYVDGPPVLTACAYVRSNKSTF